MESALYSLHILVSGRVQMVGYRYYTVYRARKYGLSGWVKNLYDGKVEIEAEGNRSSLTMFLEDIRVGPSSAEVSHVLDAWSEIDSRNHNGFNVVF
jgi:acylphosphatase